MSEVHLASSRSMAVRAWGSALRNLAEWFEAKINGAPGFSFAVLTLFYGVMVVSLSSVKLLWLDELITLHIARLTGPAAIWNALVRGADPNPPITHLLVHYSRSIFGDHEWAYRLPAFAGYWVGMLSLFLYLKPRLPATWALAGTVLSMTMAAFDYSFESRSYAIFYGFAMLAFLLWTRAIGAANAQARTGSLVGMAIALAAGISTNYFAVLAFLPIALGEMARTVMRANSLERGVQPVRGTSHGGHWRGVLRVIDFRIWIALAASGAPLLAYRPMIAHSIAQFSPYAWNKVSVDQVFDSYTEMVEAMLYPILALFVLGLLTLLLRHQLMPACHNCRQDLSERWVGRVLFGRRRVALPAHEMVAIAAFMAYPILGYIIASIRGGMLSPRFVIPVCFGFAIAATLIAYQLFGSLRLSGFAMLCFCLAWFVAREAYVGYSYEEQKQCFYKVLDKLPEAEANFPSNVPLVVPDPLLALTFQHYAPPAVARRVIFPIDFPAVRTYRGDDSPEQNLWAGRDWLYSLPILPMASFQHAAGRYLIIAGDRNWLIDDLKRHHYPVTRLQIETRAESIGGFTPLAHGTPEFYAACGDEVPCEEPHHRSAPQPFHIEDNLPGGSHP